MIDRNFLVVGNDEGDISLDYFTAVLSQYNSPALAAAQASYEQLKVYPVSIRALLAMAIHDSSLSTAGINVTHNTKNPGNTRTCSLPYVTRKTLNGITTYHHHMTGALVGTQVNTPKGVFVRYESFVDGWADMAYRLISPAYPYAQQNARTLAQVIYLYAPPKDGNKPENYIADCIRLLKGFAMAGPDRYSRIDGLPCVWIPSPPSNYNSGHGPYELIVIHDIEGSAASGIATLQNPSREASTHFVTDPLEKRIVQMVGTHSTAWTSGNNKGNTNGLNIENPGFAGLPYDADVVSYCGRLCGVLSKDFGIPLVRLNREQANTPGVKGVCGHGDLNQRGDPSNWHWDPGPTWPWETMLTIARNVAGGGIGVDPVPPGEFFPNTGFGILGGIRDSFTASGSVSRFGYPRSWEYDTWVGSKPVRIQWFERARAEYWGPGTDITWGLLGSEFIEMMRGIHDATLWLDDLIYHPWAFVPGKDNWPKPHMYGHFK